MSADELRQADDDSDDASGDEERSGVSPPARPPGRRRFVTVSRKQMASLTKFRRR